jgi:hypothetical protein
MPLFGNVFPMETKCEYYGYAASAPEDDLHREAAGSASVDLVPLGEEALDADAGVAIDRTIGRAKSSVAEVGRPTSQ